MKYYKVITRFFDDGRVTARKQIYRNLTQKPENWQGELNGCGVYHNWFEVEEEADALVSEARCLSYHFVTSLQR